MANVLFKRIEDSSLINSYPITDGSFIVTKDGKVFIDYGEERVPVIVKKRPAGIIEMYGGTTAPEGSLLCDGSAVSRTTYSELFEAIGTSYGPGDNSTTFNLPNFKGLIPVGLDSNDSDFNALGKTGGEKKHTLTVNELPSHRHLSSHVVDSTHGGGDYGWNTLLTDGANNPSGWNNNTDYTGGNQAHNILQPYTVVNYIITY